MKSISAVTVLALLLSLVACASTGTSSRAGHLDKPDAARFVIDVRGSTIAYPAAGTATLTLKDSSSEKVVATRDFAWLRTGNLLKLADPNAVNEWALANHQNADTLAFVITFSPSGTGCGQQRIAVSSVYERTELASSSSTFYLCTAD